MNRAVAVVVLVMLVMVGVGWWTYPALPAQVPSHWNMAGEVDAWQTPRTAVLFMPIVSVVIVLLLWAIGRSDRRQAIQQALAHTMSAMMVFFLVLHVSILRIAVGDNVSLPRIVTTSIGVLFGVLGIIMRELPPNTLIGIRVRWTLSDAAVWHATHQHASIVMAGAGGVLVLVAWLPITVTYVFVLLFVTISVAVLWSTGYAYWCYRRLHETMRATRDE